MPEKDKDFDLVPNLDSMKGFFDVVLSEFKFEDFRRVYDRLINKHHANKEAFYSELQKRVMPLKGNIFSSINALRNLQNALVGQALDILGGELPKDANALEIGTLLDFCLVTDSVKILL